MSLEKLGAGHVLATVVALERRIDARFPIAGWHQVSLALVTMVDRVASVSVVRCRAAECAG
jgi:hypothetical protein